MTEWFRVVNAAPVMGISFAAVAQHRTRIERNHGQTLEQLNERGGLDWYELWCGFLDYRLYPIQDVTMEAARKAVLDRVTAASLPNPDAVSDHFLGGGQSIVATLRPRFAGWYEIPVNPRLLEIGGIARMWMHDKNRLAVISAVEVSSDGKIDKGPEYHLSISRQTPQGIPRRCTSDTARWVLRQFGLDGAEEDNHVPNGVVRNFWRPVAEPLIGLVCDCKEDEPAIVEDKGDFVWRPPL